MSEEVVSNTLRHGIVTNVAWLPNQVALTVEFTATDKSVVVQSADQFVNAFTANILNANNRLIVDAVKGMWVDVETDDTGFNFIVGSYPKLILLDDQLKALVFGPAEESAE